jgi:hypothetical protein
LQREHICAFDLQQVLFFSPNLLFVYEILTLHMILPVNLHPHLHINLAYPLIRECIELL